MFVVDFYVAAVAAIVARTNMNYFVAKCTSTDLLLVVITFSPDSFMNSFVSFERNDSQTIEQISVLIVSTPHLG